MIDPNEKLRFVQLEKFSAQWSTIFETLSLEIKSILKNHLLEIHHIGSTAIPDIYAKPIIDILVIVNNIETIDDFNAQFEALNYIPLGEYGITGRRFFWKSPEKRICHVHMFQQGSSEIQRHFSFKEFMLKHPEYAKSYSLIKQNLALVFPQDIENYVNGKASFVQMIDYTTGNAPKNQIAAQDNVEIVDYNPAWPKLAEAEINNKVTSGPIAIAKKVTTKIKNNKGVSQEKACR